jgi:tetratricopeptide (TPR) repeat protein
MKHSLWMASVLAVGMAILPIPLLAQDSAKGLTTQAQQECDQGRLAKERGMRLAHFQQGQTLAEQAVMMDEHDANAHFVLFCNLGEQLRIDGESITSVFGFRRMMKELDRALELNPAHLDALSAKGTFLVKLPGILGGDPEKGRQLLQQVIKQEPKAVNARLALAKVLCEHGRHQEAVTLASDALVLAKKHGQADFIPEATAVLEQVQTNATRAN